MVQGGDPTGSGRGGESIYGAPFQDEIHQRIRFNHRGQVAMANSGPGTNASQFFLTLAPCAWLDKKHTIFGKVTGNTIFNVLKVGDTEVDSNDFPRGDPPKLLSIEVLANPFGDMVARSRKGKGRAAGSGAGEDEEEVEELRFDMGGKRKKGKKKKKKKDLNLLSFGIEAGEEEAAVAAKGTDSQLFLHLRDGIFLLSPTEPRSSSIRCSGDALQSRCERRSKAGQGGTSNTASLQPHHLLHLLSCALSCARLHTRRRHMRARSGRESTVATASGGARARARPKREAAARTWAAAGASPTAASKRGGASARGQLPQRSRRRRMLWPRQRHAGSAVMVQAAVGVQAGAQAPLATTMASRAT